jgi:hypothetical protein
MSLILVDLDLLEREKIIDTETRLSIELWHKNHGKHSAWENMIAVQERSGML